jgi:hypothetical protein
MEHKLIMENWRKLLRELDVNPVAGSTSMDTAPLVTKGLSNDQAIKYSDTVKKVYKGDIGPEVGKIFASAGLILVKELGLLFEPTGQIADVNIDTGKITYTYQLVDQSSKAAVAAYKRGDYLAAGLNSAGAALGALAMIPIVGKLAKIVGKTAKLTKTTKKIIDNSKQIKLQLDSIPVGQRTPELNDAINKLETEIARVENLTPMATKRTSSYINDLTRKIKGSVMSKLKKGQVKIGKNVNDATPITFEIPRDVRFDSMTGKRITKRSKVEKIEVRIVASNEEAIKVPGFWRDAGEGGYISATIMVPEKYLRKMTSGKLVMGEPRVFFALQSKLEATLKHELTHGAQYAKPGKLYSDRGGKYLKYYPKKDHGDKSYHAYRMQKVEVEPFAVQAAVKPKAIRNWNYDTLDRLVRDISDVYSDLDNFTKKIVDDPKDLKKFLQGDKSIKFKTNNRRYKGESPKIGFARSRREFQLFEKEVKTAQSMRPCAAISATNALLLWDMGLYDIEKTGMNRQIYDELKKAVLNPRLGLGIPVPINPKACSYKSLREWQEDQDSKQILY